MRTSDVGWGRCHRSGSHIAALTREGRWPQHLQLLLQQLLLLLLALRQHTKP